MKMNYSSQEIMTLMQLFNLFSCVIYVFVLALTLLDPSGIRQYLTLGIGLIGIFAFMLLAEFAFAWFDDSLHKGNKNK